MKYFIRSKAKCLMKFASFYPQRKVKSLEAQVNDLTSSSADRQGTLEKTLVSLRQEKDQLTKEKEEVSINL